MDLTEDLSSPTWRRHSLSDFLVLAAVLLASFSLLYHPPPLLPLNLFVLLSLLVLNESMRRSLAQGCSSACLLGEEIGLEQGEKMGQIEAHCALEHLKAFSSSVWTETTYLKSLNCDSVMVLDERSVQMFNLNFP